MVSTSHASNAINLQSPNKAIREGRRKKRGTSQLRRWPLVILEHPDIIYSYEKYMKGMLPKN